MKEIYRGIWADKLENGQELPIGGSLFSDELTTRLILDFDHLRKELGAYLSPQIFSQRYETNGRPIVDLLARVGSTIDSYLFFIADVIQRKVHEVMEIKPGSPSAGLERQSLFEKGKPFLTDLKGIAACAEQAALGQYLLQHVLQEGYSSAYMSGVETENPQSDLNNHSFIVAKDVASKTYIFDIARPHVAHTFPRILETDIPFNYESFCTTRNLLIGATEVLQGGRSYFGVGRHLSLDKPRVASPEHSTVDIGWPV